VKRIISILISISFFLHGFSQAAKSPDDIKLYYRSSTSYGVFFHTQGLGASFKYQQHLSYKLKRFYSIEYQNLKHPKQEKIVNASDNSAKGFYFSKVNALTNMRFGIGQQKAIALKEIKKGVQLSWIYSGGFNLGFLKPIYLEIYKTSGPDFTVQERYDPEIHPLGTIYGRGNYFKGVGEMEFVPGLYTKFGLNFEYSPYDEKLKSMEVGVAVDWFYKEVPLMYGTYNNQYWVTFYLMFELGKKME
jgi:hypothetical protein